MAALRRQQIRLGLLKAARVLFSQQENLLQIMTSKSDVIDDEYQYSLFQQLLSAATRPSPVKAMFGKEELEGAAVSICQYLASEVHSPQANEATQKKQPRKVSTSAKKPLSIQSASSPVVTPTVPEPPPPSRIVSQIMEMGFQRRRIEYAIQVSIIPCYAIENFAENSFANPKK